jgi:hypothetical protein
MATSTTTYSNSGTGSGFQRNTIRDHVEYTSAWDQLLATGSIQAGKTIIQKNAYNALDVSGVGSLLGDPVKSVSDLLTNKTGQVGDTVAYPFRSSTGDTITSKVKTASVGKYQIDSLLGQSVQDSVQNVGNAVGSAIEATAGAIGDVALPIGRNIEAASKAINRYVAPISETMMNIQKIGDKFDEIIKDTFLQQIFKIKGTEILCTMFCIIISFLDCKTRQGLYETLRDLKQATKAINTGIANVNQLTTSPVEIPLVNNKTIADTAVSLFSNSSKENATKALGIPQGTETKKASMPLEVPANVKTIISDLTKVLSVLAKGQITLPVGISSGIWDFAQAVLFIVQTILIQMADEFMTAVVKKVEKLLQNVVPQICIGNLASLFINKIIAALQTLKAWFIKQLKGLLGDSQSFNIKWKTFGWYFKEIQDLLAMLKALTLVLGRFPELAMICGVQPCEESMSNDQVAAIKDAINNGQLVKETNEPATVRPSYATPRDPNSGTANIPTYTGVPGTDVTMTNTPGGTFKTLDEIADIFKKMTGKDNLKIITRTDGFDVVMPDLYTNAPKKIKDIINTQDFLNALGSAYTVYSSPDVQEVNIVYSFNKVCGA